MGGPPLIVILEDDPGCIFVYEEIFAGRYDTRICRSIAEFRAILTAADPPSISLVIADVKLPDGSFSRFVSEEAIRKAISCPFIIVSMIDDIEVLRHCFETGAVDYLTKPFSKNELLVKVDKLMTARSAGKGPLVVDPTFRTVKVADGRAASLTPKELQVFELIRAAGDVGISRQDLLDRLWDDQEVGSRTLDVHIYNLRRKLQAIDVEIAYRPPQTYLVAIKVSPQAKG